MKLIDVIKIMENKGFKQTEQKTNYKILCENNSIVYFRSEEESE